MSRSRPPPSSTPPRGRSSPADVLLMAAAVADFRPAEPEDAKIKKAGRDGLGVELEPTDDVLAGALRRRRPGQVDRRLRRRARRGRARARRGKLERKGLDAVVLNDISRPEIGFDSADNEVTIVTAGGDGRCRAGPRPPWRLPSSDRGAREPTPSQSLPRQPEERGEGVYDLFTRGSELLEAGDFAAAAIPLERARRSSPTRPRSARRSAAPTSARAASRQRRRGVRGGGRARAGQRLRPFLPRQGAVKTGRPREARRHAALAACMRPTARTTGRFRDRLRAACARC